MPLVSAARTHCALLFTLGLAVQAAAPHAQSSQDYQAIPLERPRFAEAQRQFYSGHYQAAAALTLEYRANDTAGSRQLRAAQFGHSL